MVIMDIGSMGFKYQLQINLYKYLYGARAIMINNEFHVIGGSPNPRRKHLKWNDASSKFEILHDSKNCNVEAHAGLIKVKNKVLTFGGEVCRLSNYDYIELNDINEYDIIGDKWSQSTIKMPIGMCSFGFCKALHGQYVILLGGKSSDGITDKIWSYNVKNETIRESSIKCPEAMPYQAFTINYKGRDLMTVSGYIRREWRISQIDDYLFPPEYLIRIMTNYYLNEEIHLVCAENSHWKINVTDIIC